MRSFAFVVGARADTRSSRASAGRGGETQAGGRAAGGERGGGGPVENHCSLSRLSRACALASIKIKSWKKRHWQSFLPHRSPQSVLLSLAVASVFHLRKMAGDSSRRSGSGPSSNSKPGASAQAAGRDPLANLPPGATMWQAPQSWENPTGVLPPDVRATIRRSAASHGSSLADYKAREAAAMERLSQPEIPARWQRFSQLAGAVLATGAAGYAIFLHDFGEKEHVFSPVSTHPSKGCAWSARLTVPSAAPSHAWTSGERVRFSRQASTGRDLPTMKSENRLQ